MGESWAETSPAATRVEVDDTVLLSLQDPNAFPVPTFQDLAGFWDLLQLSIEDVSMKFAELQQLKDNGWKIMEPKVSTWPCRCHSSRHLCLPPPPQAHLHPNPKSASASQLCQTPQDARSLEVLASPLP